MDIFYEQNVANPNIDKHRKRSSVLSVVRTVLLVIGIALGYLLFSFAVNFSSVMSAVIGIVIVIISISPFVVSFILLGKFLRNTNAEYDYILNGDILRIVKVIRRTKRKLMATVQMSMVESVGKVTCEAYDRYAAAKDIKKQFAVCNYDDEESIVYVRYRNEGEDYLLHLEPDEEMINSIRRSLPRIGIMDKSLTSPITKK